MLSAAGEGALVLPPLFEAVFIADPSDVHAHACRIAAQSGAGTLVYAISEETVALAIVLEPDKPLVAARLAFFAGMAAMGDSLAFHCVPERQVAFAWPDEFLFDLARLGGARLAVPEGTDDDDVPEWMVFSVELIHARPSLADPGAYPGSTSLVEEEFDPPEAIIESFTRHLMRAFDAMATEGMSAVTTAYLERLQANTDRDWMIDGRGDLLQRGEPGAAPTRQSLSNGLAACRWYNPVRKAPLL